MITANGTNLLQSIYYNEFSAIPKAHPNPLKKNTVHSLYTWIPHLDTVEDRIAGEENSSGKTIPYLCLPPF